MPRATSAEQWRWPTVHDRVAIYGRTGDGKTVLATWLLSEAPFDRIPYYVLDFKRDDLLNSTDRIKRVALKDKLTRHPGIYIIHANPHETAAVENFMWRVRANGRTGLFIDEGYMLGRDTPAFDAILTQGRSLRIPVINLTQRPVWLSRFVTSQADCHALFPFNDDRDNDTVLKFMPREIRNSIEKHGEDGLPKYHCYWFDVQTKLWFILGKAPDPADITQRLDERLQPRRNRL